MPPRHSLTHASTLTVSPGMPPSRATAFCSWHGRVPLSSGAAAFLRAPSPRAPGQRQRPVGVTGAARPWGSFWVTPHLPAVPPQGQGYPSKRGGPPQAHQGPHLPSSGPGTQGWGADSEPLPVTQPAHSTPSPSLSSPAWARLALLSRGPSQQDRGMPPGHLLLPGGGGVTGQVCSPGAEGAWLPSRSPTQVLAPPSPCRALVFLLVKRDNNRQNPTTTFLPIRRPPPPSMEPVPRAQATEEGTSPL